MCKRRCPSTRCTRCASPPTGCLACKCSPHCLVPQVRLASHGLPLLEATVLTAIFRDAFLGAHRKCIAGKGSRAQRLGSRVARYCRGTQSVTCGR